MPIIRAMWLHYPDDAIAVGRGDQYLWGRDMLVAPVAEKGATSRRLYLPRGRWHDFWTSAAIEGGREIARDVDLATTPLYVRAGAVIPMGPVRQYTSEPSDQALTLVVYPGASGESAYYEDDGTSFNYRRGESMRLLMHWDDVTRRLSLRLAPGSRMIAPTSRPVVVRVAGAAADKRIAFTGQPVEVAL
jgi:alpha-glucosidase (family GH31 glycosyl hydrolase)